MSTAKYLAITAVILSLLAGIALVTSADSSADESEYVVYFIIDDPRLNCEELTIDQEGVYITGDYVFYKRIIATSDTEIGILPSTHNIVSRFYDTDLLDMGYVLNPDGADYGMDVSGWFEEGTYENRVTSESTLGDLDSQGNGRIFLHMKAARVYDVTYHACSWNGGWVPYEWYDGYHLERDNVSGYYTEGRFSEVNYIISLVEGQTVGDNLATSGNLFAPEGMSVEDEHLPYLPLSNWAKGDGSYNMDVFESHGQSFSWIIWNPDYYHAIEANKDVCTPVYPGMTVTDELDTDGNGVIELYGISTRTSGEELSFFLTYTFADEDKSGNKYGDTGYSGYVSSDTDKIGASLNGNNVVFSNYKLLIPDHVGFRYSSVSCGSGITCTNVGYETVDGVYGRYATLSGTINKNNTSYSSTVTVNYVREVISITVYGETTEHIGVAYDCDLVLPASFVSHQLHNWETSGLHNNIWKSGNAYYYTVCLDDIYEDWSSSLTLNEEQHSITAVWQDVGTQNKVYTIHYDSRVGIHIADDIVDGDDYFTLPMIQYTGYSHLGWALINPGQEIDTDTSLMIIYPGRTSLEPYNIDNIYKTVDPQNPNLVSITLYAVWCSTYTIAFDANGGSGSMNAMMVMTENDFALPLNTFTRDKYRFLGWSTTDDGDVEFTDGQIITEDLTSPRETITLYAKWELTELSFRVWQLKYNNNQTANDKDAELIFGQRFIIGSTVTFKLADDQSKYSTYTRSDYTYYLTGWKFVKNSQTLYQFNDGQTVKVSEQWNGCTINPIYTKSDYKVTIRYHINTGGEDETMDVTYITNKNKADVNASLPECPFQYDGHVFCLWSKSNNSISDSARPGGTLSFSKVTSGTTVHIYAIWIAIPVIADQTYNGDEICPLSANLSIEGNGSVITTVSSNNSESASSTKYGRTYENNIHAGQATVEITMPSTKYSSMSFSITFNILPAGVLIEVDSGQGKIYGENDPQALTGRVTFQTQVNVSDLVVNYSRVKGENVGTYLITASFNNSDYYLVSLSEDVFTITPAIVYVTADDASKDYGEDDPVFTGTISCSTSPYDILGITFCRSNDDEDPGTYVGVITATYTSNRNYQVIITTGTFTISQPALDYVYYIILDGRGGGETYTDTASVMSGSPFPSKTVTANTGYSFHEWVRATYSGDTIIALTHVTYSNTLDSEDISAGETYIAMFTAGDGIVFNANGGTGSMEMQEFSDSSNTLSENGFEKDGYIFLGWSLTSNGPVKYSDRTPLFKISGLSTTDNQNVLYAVWAPYTYTSTLEWNTGAEPNPIQLMNNGDSSIDADDLIFTPEAVISDKEDIDLIMKIGALSFAMVCAAGAAIIISHRR